MNLSHIRESSREFHVLQTTGRLQTASILLRAGKATSDKPEIHEDSDQMVLVLEGRLLAIIGSERQTIEPGESVIVPAGTPHRFCNESGERAFAFTVYGPPAYPEDE
jgi:mannose-6-phosphate isomerase-like protein (cupin superfamily)